MRRPNRRPNYMETGDIVNWEDAMDYIIYTRGTDIVAVNGSTGKETSRNTDFATVLQHAIDQFADTPGTIYIKPPGSGIYSVETPITIANGTYGLSIISGGIRWASEGVTLEAGNDTATPIIEDLNGGQAFTAFKGLSFLGHEAVENWNVTGLKAFGQDTLIENCSFKDCQYGLWTRTNPWILRNWIEVNVIGHRIEGACSFVQNNLFWNNEVDIQIAVAVSDQFIMCNRASASEHFVNAIKPAGTTDNVTIIGNILRDHTDSIINLYKTAGANWVIANNIADGGGTADYFIENEATFTPSNMLVANNTLTNMETGYINDMTGMTVHGNTGFLTENGGVTGNVADGGTFAHGLGGTPTYCIVIGTVAGDLVSVSGLGAANVTVNIKDEGGGAGTAQPLYWRAYL